MEHFRQAKSSHIEKHEILIERARQNFYETDYLSNYTSTVIAFIGALQITILYVEGLFIGSLFDSFGLKVSLLTVLHLCLSNASHSGCTPSVV